MSIVEQYYFPVDFQLELQIHGDWEALFKDFVKNIFAHS